ncbi:MAG: hypothetical protein KAY65_10255 [Planctomycetes bacterium]|nr:hypothetical protein [Planctomycetota bacterium]
MRLTILTRDLPYNVTIGTSTHNIVNNTIFGASISRGLVTNMADTPPGKALKHANSPKIQHFGGLSTYADRRFFPSGTDFR